MTRQNKFYELWIHGLESCQAVVTALKSDNPDLKYLYVPRTTWEAIVKGQGKDPEAVTLTIDGVCITSDIRYALR